MGVIQLQKQYKHGVSEKRMLLGKRVTTACCYTLQSIALSIMLLAVIEPNYGHLVNGARVEEVMANVSHGGWEAGCAEVGEGMSTEPVLGFASQHANKSSRAGILV